MLRRVIVALIAIVLFSLILAIWSYVPVAERNPDTYYAPFGSYIPVFLMFLAPAYFLGGIPISMLIDRFVKNKGLQPIFYILAGFVTGLFVYLIFAGLVSDSVDEFFRGLWLNDMVSFGIFGAAGAFLFSVILFLTGLFWSPKNT
ncbi:MAG TPA: hypothetical protein VFK33_17360 [Bacillales bacterium]|nr:hypothetical protein [Bacillales bacterium]